MGGAEHHPQPTCCSSSIVIKHTCLIKPSTPTPPQHMFLSAVDIFWRWFPYNQRLLFFPLHGRPSPHHVQSLIDQLKTGLSLALVEFFPFAGRFFEQADGRLALDCNDAGVVFIEASIDVPYLCLEEEGFQHKPFFRHLAPHGDVRRWSGPQLPLLSVQVTRFTGDEGIVVGIGHSHSIADGSSLWHFMKSWGECSRGLPISSHPVHMRGMLGPEQLILPPQENGSSQKSITQGATLKIDPPIEELVQRDFHFTAEMVRKLKGIATSSLGVSRPSSPLSSFQALCAHIWKHVTAATKMDKEKKCGMFVLANMRSRLVPPLPETYFGNAIVRECAIATVGELEEESLGETAEHIQELVRCIDDKLFKEFLGKMEELEPAKLFEGFDFRMFTMQVSSSPRFPVYDVDLGFGAPACVRSPLIRRHGEMVWFPGREGGGSMDVSLALTPHVMERLEHDPCFLSL